MSRNFLRSLMISGLVASIALAGCSNSDSSGIRTRNSATVTTCMQVGLSTTDAYLTAYIQQPGCAAGLVELSERNYPNDLTSSDPAGADQEVPGFSNLGYFHGFSEFDIAFEARDEENAPVEYIRAKGNGAVQTSVVFERSTIAPITVFQSCLQPVNNENYLGFNTTCNSDGQSYTYLITLVREDGAGRRVFYERSTEAVYFGRGVVTPFRYLSVVALRNDVVHSKLTMTKNDNENIDVRAYQYSEPVVLDPISNDVPSSTTSTIVESSTSSTLVDEITPPEESSTTSVEVTETTSASEVSSASIGDVCGQLDGVEIYPGTDSWNESTRFLLGISNDCMKAAARGSLGSVGFNLQARAVNQSDGRTVRFNGIGSIDQQIQFSGRLYAGNWKFTIRQQVNGPDLPSDIDAFLSFDVTVKTDDENPWDVCASSDIQWDGSQLTLNCTYTNAQVNYIASGFKPELTPMGPGQAVELPRLISGWSPVSIEIENDGFTSWQHMTLCTSNCEELPSAVPAKVSRSNTSVSIFVPTSACNYEEIPFVGVHYLSYVNNKLMTHSPRTINSGTSGIDLVVQEDVLSKLDIPQGVDHLLVFRLVDPEIEGCGGTTNFPRTQWSIVAIPKEVTTSEQSVEPVASISPAVVESVEFSQTDSVGTPILVSEDQTIIELPAVSLPDSLFASGSNVASVSARIGNNKWQTVTKNLSTLLKIDPNASEVQIKYTFKDGSESIVTKPLESVTDYDKKVAENTSSSSNSSLLILVALVIVAISAGAVVVIRRKS